MAEELGAKDAAKINIINQKYLIFETNLSFERPLRLRAMISYIKILDRMMCKSIADIPCRA